MHRTTRIKLLFLLPAVVWVLCFTIFPLVFSLRLSLYNTRVDESGKFIDDFIGLGNYRGFLKDEDALASLRVTLVFVGCGVTAQMVLGLALALLFNRPLPLRGLMRTLLTAPLFATPMAAGIVFITIFHEESGLIRSLLHLKVPWLSSTNWALVSVVIVDIWQWTPFCFLIFLAALQGIPEDYYEAARLETKSGWTIFRHITLPFLKPTIVLVLLLRITDAFKVFDVPATMTNGGPFGATQVLTLYAYRQGMTFFNYGYSSCISFVLFILVTGLILVLFKRLRQVYR